MKDKSIAKWIVGWIPFTYALQFISGLRNIRKILLRLQSRSYRSLGNSARKWTSPSDSSEQDTSYEQKIKKEQIEQTLAKVNLIIDVILLMSSVSGLLVCSACKTDLVLMTRPGLRTGLKMTFIGTETIAKIKNLF